MDTRSRGKLAAYLKLLSRHRGEAAGAYDEVAAVYDDFTKVWDQHVAATALVHVNHLIEERVKPDAVVLDGGTTFPPLRVLQSQAVCRRLDGGSNGGQVLHCHR